MLINFELIYYIFKKIYIYELFTFGLTLVSKTSIDFKPAIIYLIIFNILP